MPSFQSLLISRPPFAPRVQHLPPWHHHDRHTPHPQHYGELYHCGGVDVHVHHDGDTAVLPIDVFTCVLEL
eukprot:11527462-Alexandrium_andersonii.AAC.1